MPYLLENITLQDQEKIINDAIRDELKHGSLMRAREWGKFANTWAVDRGRDCYFLLAPILVREEAMDRPYYAYIDGQMYKIKRVGWTQQVYFDEQNLPSGPRLLEIQEEVRNAFAVYGEWGQGPMNQIGKPQFALNPEFIDKKGD